ncbi:MAG TPA: type II toxin-antitoxin system RelE/ParE family toxin [Longimicrobium sp.]|nr:type II toxin-antitoxin system RelE/ParE family toxin [Longimicrobium sp.]
MAGACKVRVALPGRGRSGGARVVYFYVEIAERIYLLYVFAKNERENVSAVEKAALKKLADLLREEH